MNLLTWWQSNEKSNLPSFALGPSTLQSTLVSKKKTALQLLHSIDIQYRVGSLRTMEGVIYDPRIELTTLMMAFSKPNFNICSKAGILLLLKGQNNGTCDTIDQPFIGIQTISAPTSSVSVVVVSGIFDFFLYLFFITR